MVWVATAKPASATIRATAGRFRTLRPMKKNVAGTCSSSRIDTISAVNSDGPSSKVNATTGAFSPSSIGIDMTS